MRNLMLAFALIFSTVGLYAQSQVKAESLIEFKELTYDFGKIKQGVPVTHDFVFTNISSRPVIIESATATCGCTTPVKPEPPVAKGKSDKITAGYNSAVTGPFNKSIYIKVAGAPAPIELKIVGEVLSPSDYAKYKEGKK